MPYNKIEDLPPAVKKLPAKKQRQWMAVFNSVWERGADESSCFAQAWGAVKKAFLYNDDFDDSIVAVIMLLDFSFEVNEKLKKAVDFRKSN